LSDTFQTAPSFADVKKAHEIIARYAHNTPVMSSKQVNERAGAEIFFKCENYQKVGAFKFRGGCNAILPLDDEVAKHGVATHSSGNHAQAVALAAKMKGIPAYIVMPENSPKVKIEAVKGYDAEITFCAPTLEARENTLDEVVERTGASFIHPYNDSRIIAGQGTAALELLEAHPELDVIITPVGGGGLLSGTAIASKGIKPEITVIGAEPEVADDAYRSFKSGELLPNTNVNTIADGLRTSLGSLPFSIIQEKVDDIVTVSEEEIIEAMRFIWERMKMIIEPSCAVPVAAVFRNKINLNGKKTGIIITGGNVDLDNLPWNG
jgi:threonine dehydratase